MIETCPSCKGDRILDDPDRLAAFVHEARCALANAERETFAADLARHRRFATYSRRRAATQAERLLLAASGLSADSREPVHTQVTWSGGVRRRTWSRRPLLSETSEVSP